MRSCGQDRSQEYWETDEPNQRESLSVLSTSKSVDLSSVTKQDQTLKNETKTKTIQLKPRPRLRTRDATETKTDDSRP